MHTLKQILFGLLFLFAVSLLFNQPGVDYYEYFVFFFRKLLQSTQSYDYLTIFTTYPPGLFALLSSSYLLFKPNLSVFLYNQNAFYAFKYFLLGGYLLTWLSVLYFVKSSPLKSRISLLDTSIAYFVSVSILLTCVALAYPDIFAAPFFVLSLAFTFQKKLLRCILFYLLAISFNWSLMIFSPLFFIIFWREIKSYHYKILSAIAFLVTPGIISVSLLLNSILHKNTFFPEISTKLLGFPWLISRPFAIILQLYVKSKQIDVLDISLMVVALVVSVLSLGWLISKFYTNIFHVLIQKSKLLFYLPTVLFLIVSMVIADDSFKILFLFLTIFTYLCLVINFKSYKDYQPVIILNSSFAFYLAYTLFFPGSSEGNLVWLVLLSLLVFILYNSNFARLQLLIVNIIAFVNLFIFYGTKGLTPVVGKYFITFRSFFAIYFVLFGIWYLGNYIRNRLSGKMTTKNLIHPKRLLILLLILISFSLVTAEGSSDSGAWSRIAKASASYQNVFLAHVYSGSLYPPLSTAIIDFFTNIWKIIIGSDPYYAITIKISILSFYFISLFAFVKFSSIVGVSKKLILEDKLIIYLATFSLIISTQGLAYLEIYTIPFLILSLIFLYKKKYFFSGLIFGITISIKWEPFLLIPLFFATLINPGEKKELIIKNLLYFLVGFLPLPLIFWMLVLIQPNGDQPLQQFIGLIKVPFLSGQALNLNWIISYLLHILDPVNYLSLEHIGGLNRPFRDAYPIYLRGLPFYAAHFIILFRYWLFQKKNIVNFLTSATLIFFSHSILNIGAHENHLFYAVFLALLLFSTLPTLGHRYLLILLDIMFTINLIFFYSFTGPQAFNRLFFGFDITVLFATYYVIIYGWIFYSYLKQGNFQWLKSKN